MVQLNELYFQKMYFILKQFGPTLSTYDWLTGKENNPFPRPVSSHFVFSYVNIMREGGRALRRKRESAQEGREREREIDSPKIWQLIP